MTGAVRLRGHMQAPRSLIKRRPNGFEPECNGLVVDHPTTLCRSGRGANHPPLEAPADALISGRRLSGTGHSRVIAGLVLAIHDFAASRTASRGWPGQARP